MTSQATHSQHGIWFTEQAGAAGAAYHMGLALWLDGELDQAALAGACDAVVARHEPLRSALVEADGVLCVVPAAAPPRLRHVDYRPDLVSREVTRAYDLERGPLARFTLAQVSPGRHLLVFAAHHLVFDGMSKDILVRDLAAGYAAAIGQAGGGAGAGGAAAVAGPLPLSYGAYAAAARSRVGAETAAAREFWRDRFAEPTDPVLPGLRRTPVAAEAGAVREFTLDAGLAAAVDQAARAIGVTRFELLLAAVHVLLQRYGNPPVPVAVDMSTRDESTADHVGLFVNELPVTAPPAGDATFREFARAVRTELREIYRFRGVPISHAVGSLRPRAAICPISLSYRRRAAAQPRFTGLDTRVEWMVFHDTARNALHIQLVDDDTRVDIGLQYSPTAIDTAAVDRIGAHLRTVLAAAAADPDRPVADLPVLPDRERERLLATGTGPARSYPPELTVAAGVAAQARQTPDATAVVCGDRRLSYRDLDAAVARLAGWLHRHGTGAGDLVALCLPRSVETLVAPLAVGRLGATYLPLDPNHPARRRALILAEATPKLLLTTGALAAGLDAPLPVLTVDEVPAGSFPEPVEPPVAPEGTAYVIYTSGSTGRPKGVAVPHRAMTNLLLAMRDALGSGPDHAWLAQAALAFDMSVPELFLPLLVGGRTVVVPDELVRDGAGQLRLIRDQGVTHLQATPSGWQMLLDSGFGAGRERDLVGLAGAEALPAPLAAQIRSRVRRLYNVYGPTETTVWSTLAELPERVDEVTIGTPIANTYAYLLDERLRLAPDGVPAELYLGGAGVAEGYLHQPELTGQRFLPDPYHGGRMYRTGDRCVRRPGGELAYLGRADDQVKLRGHRIELGEVEAALLACPGVREAAAALRGQEDPRLVGYLVVDGEPLPPHRLRELMAATLPSIMVPTAWIALDQLPRNVNGKLDRAALPEPPAAQAAAPLGDGHGHGRAAGGGQDDGHGRAAGGGQDDGQDDGQGDGDPITEQVRTIWRDVLKIDDIALDDDLFDLGGHSLTITRIIARVHQQLGVHVPLEVFYDTPTLGEIVTAVRDLTAATTR